MRNFYITSPLKLSLPTEEFSSTQFTGIAYSGDKVFGNVVIDLATTIIEQSLPLLFQHDHNSIIGTINSIQNTGESIINSGVLFSDIDNLASSIAIKSKRGINYQQSIGLFDFEEEIIKTGSINLNHRKFNTPLTILKNGIVREVSIVALGADRKTSATFFSEKFNEGFTMSELITNTDNSVIELTAEVKNLQSRIIELTTRAELAENKLTEFRKDEIIKIFKEFGKEINPTVYLKLSESDFNQIMLDIKSLKPSLPNTLFKEQATGEVVNDKTANLSAVSIYANRK